MNLDTLILWFSFIPCVGAALVFIDGAINVTNRRLRIVYIILAAALILISFAYADVIFKFTGFRYMSNALQPTAGLLFIGLFIFGAVVRRIFGKRK